MMQYLRFFFLVWGFFIPWYSFALPSTGATHVKVELISEEKTIQPGHPFWVALHFKIDDEWHVYWKNPGDAGIPLKIDWELPVGFQAGPLKWPVPEKFNLEGMVGFGYEKEVVLLSQITPDSSVSNGSDVHLKGRVDWLVCSEASCQPDSTSVDAVLKIDSHSPLLNEGATTLFREARAKLPQSQGEAKTVHREGVIQLQMASAVPTGGAVVGAYFFPEESELIDHSVEPTIELDPLSSGKYIVNLKESGLIGAKKSSILKGVLVVHKKGSVDESSTQAFDIDSPIQETASQGMGDRDFFSMAEREEIGSLSVPSIGSPISPTVSDAHFEGGLGLALLFAFLGGMLLNLMPCVLPVLSFKVMSFVKMAGQSRSLTLKHSLAFSLGVLASFWLLASVMLILKTYGQMVGWGFQLQEPLFVVILASILFIFALSLFGLFEWGIFFASWAGQTEVDSKGKSPGYGGDFLSGVLATAVATPCTGPFLGSAVGFAVTLPLFQSLLIFTVLGLGMSFPYLLLATFPPFLRFIPKPGPWMEVFKELMGFLLLVTVLWLMWVFSAQTNSFALICLIGGFLCFAFAAWIYGKGTAPLVRRSRRLFAYVAVCAIAVLGCQLILFPRASWNQEDSISSHQTAGENGEWEPFSPIRLAELKKNSAPVLIDFTAKWCLICQANHLVLSTDEVSRELAKRGVVKMKADWTKSDPAITAELSKFGRNSVPLYVLYGANQKEPLILPQVLTTDIVLEHLKSAFDEEEIAQN